MSEGVDNFDAAGRANRVITDQPDSEPPPSQPLIHSIKLIEASV
jgi:hypothetical protein